MKPILFSPTATTFETNGLGVLADAVSCTVTEQLNGGYELAATYPVTGKRFHDLQLRGIVLAKPNPYAAAQPFRIYKISKPMRGIVTVYAHHISYDLSGIPVSPFTADGISAALAGLSENAAIPCPFVFQTDKSVAGAFSVPVPSAIRSVLGGQAGSLLDVYGGEYEWDGMTVRLLAHRGQDNGVTIRYGKNLIDLKQEENIANVATGVYPFWQSLEGKIVEAPGKIVSAPGTYSFTRIVPLDLSMEFIEEPTPAQVQAKAQAYVENNRIGVPAVSLSVAFQPLEQTEEYKHIALLERVQLGDTVTVEYPALGVSATARVVSTVYDVLLDRYEKVEIGDARATIAGTLAGQQNEIKNQQNEILQRPTATAARQLTNTILGAFGGAVRLLDTNSDGSPDTLYIADDPDPTKAVKVWRFNYEGWAASRNGYNGPFVMGAMLDDGIIADFITAGILRAKDGGAYFDLDNDKIVLENPASTTRMEFRGSGCAIVFFRRETAESEWSEIGRLYPNVNGKSSAALSQYFLGPYSTTQPFAWVDDDGNRRVLCDYLNVNDIWCDELNRRIAWLTGSTYTMAPDAILFGSGGRKMAWMDGTRRVLESDDFYLAGYKLTLGSDGNVKWGN